MALKNVKRSLDRIFDKNLQDLVRGIRNHKDSEAQYIAQCIDEIKSELKQDNLAAKANAVNKLIYLQMLGYDISWAAFNMIEVMSSPKFTFKRIGYLAASQSFHTDTDVIMLATNLIKKDLVSQNPYDAAIALSGMSCFMTNDLARDLANDVFSLMSSNRPHTRKRAVLISYKIFLGYPEALRPAFPRLKEKLDDPDPGVQSAAVNVICELARKNPKNYLSLAPIFFKLMTSSTNNWVLIKIIKLFGALTPLEPRLGKKLIEPLTNLIHNTSAMSLLYECINTVIQGMQDHAASIQLCVQKLRILIEDSDQNLKYLGLLAMSRILKTHPKAVQAHKDLILQCLDDKDESIRLRALDLLFGMVSKKNLMEIIKKLMIHAERADGSQYRDELILKIIEICSQNNYQYITNFEWYVTVLVELTRMDGCTRHGSLVASQLLDVAIRVKAIRQFVANQMAALLENAQAMMSQLKRNGMQEVLFAAAYICGEFSDLLSDPDSLIMAMLRPRVLTLPSHIQGTYIHNLLKVYAVSLAAAEEDEDRDRAATLTRALVEKMPAFVQSSYLEVQERSSCILAVLKYVEKQQDKNIPVAEEFLALFKGELNPVAPKAQRKVPVPEGLDLDAWINDPPSSSEEEPEAVEAKEQAYDDYYLPEKQRQKELTPAEIAQRREQRKKEQANNPHYLMAKAAEGYQDPDADEDPGETQQIDLSIPLHVPGLPSSERYLRMEQERRRHAQAKKIVKKKHQKKGKKKKKKNEIVSEEEEEDEIPQAHTVDIVKEELPEGAVKTDSEEETVKDDVYKALDMDLDAPLTAAETLPKPRHREVTPKKSEDNEEGAGEKTEKKKSKKKKKEKKEKSKKEKKKKSRGNEPESLLVDEPDANDVTDDVANDAAPEKDEKKDNDDLSFWLSNNDQLATEPAQVNGVCDEAAEVISEEQTKKQHKEKKKKEAKKQKKKKKQKSLEKEPEEEENSLNLSRYKVLGENKELKLDFETRSSLRQEKKIVISCVFSNLTDKHIKKIEFNVLDTLNTRLVRLGDQSSHDAVPIPFALPPFSRNECQLGLTAASVIMPQRMRGTVTYMVSDAEHTKQEKLDFKLHIPCSSYLVASPYTSANFTKLLSSGELTDKSSFQVSTQGLSLKHALQKLCFLLKFSVVEQIEQTASLYSVSIQQHHICLLVKSMANGSYSVDGKSDNSSLLSNIMEEVKAILLEK